MSEKKLQTRHGKSILLTLGTIVGMFAYAWNPHKMKVMQQIIGVQLWLGGAKWEVGNRLNMINLCQGMDAFLATIDNQRLSKTSVCLEGCRGQTSSSSTSTP